MHVESSEKFWFSAYSQIPHVRRPLEESAPGKLLHLDVVILSEVAEPLNELGGDAARELWMTHSLGKEAGKTKLDLNMFVVHISC